MTQKKVVKNKAGDIVLKDATIQTTEKNEILTVNSNVCNFFIKHKNADLNIWFTDQGIHITAYQDKDEKEIKNLVFESVTKNKKIKIKLNKLCEHIFTGLDGVEIKNR